MPRLRVRIWMVMVGVAVVAVVMGASIATMRLNESSFSKGVRADAYRMFAAEFRRAVTEGREVSFGCCFSCEVDPVNTPPSPARIAEMRRSAERFEFLARKFDRAARYPWLTVAPDPPKPE
jgi:hypothetical protein